MWWVLLGLLVVIVVLAGLLRGRGSRSLGGNPDADRPPESFRIPGSGGGNAGGFTS